MDFPEIVLFGLFAVIEIQFGAFFCAFCGYYLADQIPGGVSAGDGLLIGAVIGFVLGTMKSRWDGFLSDSMYEDD